MLRESGCDLYGAFSVVGDGGGTLVGDATMVGGEARFVSWGLPATLVLIWIDSRFGAVVDAGDDDGNGDCDCEGDGVGVVDVVVVVGSCDDVLLGFLIVKLGFTGLSSFLHSCKHSEHIRINECDVP